MPRRAPPLLLLFSLCLVMRIGWVPSPVNLLSRKLSFSFFSSSFLHHFTLSPSPSFRTPEHTVYAFLLATIQALLGLQRLSFPTDKQETTRTEASSLYLPFGCISRSIPRSSSSPSLKQPTCCNRIQTLQR